MLITIDIETLPSSDPEVIREFEESIAPPANYKKQESIDQWMAENKASLLKEKLAKTSFDGLYGSIACIAYAIEGEVFSVDSISSGNEKTMLEHFYSHLYDKTTVEYRGGSSDIDVTFVGHNIAGFDLPFLKHRSIILGVKPVSIIAKAFSAKPWDKCIADTMLMWSSDREKRVSLDKLCKAFGIPGKGDFDGSMVAETWPVDPQKVIDYCKDDVTRALRVYQRIAFQP